MFGIPLHRLIIHFPIALMMVAVIYDAWAVYSKTPELHQIGYGLTLWAAVSGLAAVVTGLQLAGVTRLDLGAATGHAGFGIGSGIAITALGILRYSANAREQRHYRMSWLVLEVGSAGLIIATAVTGHRL